MFWCSSRVFFSSVGSSTSTSSASSYLASTSYISSSTQFGVKGFRLFYRLLSWVGVVALIAFWFWSFCWLILSILASVLIASFNIHLLLQGWSYLFLVSCYEYDLIRFQSPVSRIIWFRKLRLTTALLSIFLFLFFFVVDCIFCHQLCLTVSLFPVTRIAPIIVRLFRIGSSWVYLYCSRTTFIDQFNVNFDWTISINRFSELTRTISIDLFTEIARTISICNYCWLSTSGAFFWIIPRVERLLPLSLSYPLYQYISLQIGSFVFLVIWFKISYW